ncbi:hypothetical protein [Mesorhizobium sp.]|uniref:hypothetical protein n=1 Tax=Mesorhizobium sp. TaxID=1871066 RepID=UPI000FE796E2|nr:hypothetical protein [Mesorhizobium sp.]RWC30853.1 MAG: hypothetical protein EOS27_11970 [Mesorhizobium sp.]RWC55052.1 MAG: hypothetical protein EOS56_27425 [Mesorhizobium sp.]RWC65063.1 MAG: hypothetical protein EOS29_10475 [Mesorhizobium sp.]
MDVFDSAVRTKGDLAGVFEYSEAGDPQTATAYFYLYRAQGNAPGSVVDAIHMRSGAWAISAPDIAIRWDKRERRVGLFIFGALSAAFDTEAGTKHGGGYGKDFHADIPWSESN